MSFTLSLSPPEAKVYFGDDQDHYKTMQDLEMEKTKAGLLGLPQELRDHIYSFLFLEATATTEHPFHTCRPTGRRRFHSYFATCLVNKTLYQDVKPYFTKHIAPHVTFSFTSVHKLRHFVQLYAFHPVLRTSNFRIQCSHRDFYPYTVKDREEVEALIRIQPGFTWFMDEVPGFYRSTPPTITNYGYWAQTGAKVWKPEKNGYARFEQTGGEICDSKSCYQRIDSYPLYQTDGAQYPILPNDLPFHQTVYVGVDPVSVTEVRYPPLKQDRHADVEENVFRPSGRGTLTLTGYLWTDRSKLLLGAQNGHTLVIEPEERAVMALEGNLRDVWLPNHVVEMYLRKRSERMQ